MMLATILFLLALGGVAARDFNPVQGDVVKYFNQYLSRTGVAFRAESEHVWPWVL